jgi:L-alanine-DL-glutamate epimerase-like enolase superfamily enzyme
MGEEAVTVQNGNLRVPDGPGLGVTLVPEVLKVNLKETEPYWD